MQTVESFKDDLNELTEIFDCKNKEETLTLDKVKSSLIDPRVSKFFIHVDSIQCFSRFRFAPGIKLRGQSS